MISILNDFYFLGHDYFDFEMLTNLIKTIVTKICLLFLKGNPRHSFNVVFNAYTETLFKLRDLFL